MRARFALVVLLFTTLGTATETQAGNYFVSLRDGYFDAGTNQIALVTESNGVITGVNDNFITSNLSGPTGMAIGPNGHLFVANAFSNTIQEYNAQTGAYVGLFADAGDGLDGPTALRFHNGNFYVANLSSPLAPDGQTVLKITPSGNASTFVGGLQAPDGLLFDDSNNLYVSEAVPYSSDPAGYHFGQFDSNGAQSAGPFNDSLLQWPAGMAKLPGTDDVLIAQVLGGNVVRYDGAGGFSEYVNLSSFGVFPVGVQFIDDDTFWVFDSAGAVIFRYDIIAGNPVLLGVEASYASFGYETTGPTGTAIGDIISVPEPNGIALILIGSIGLGMKARCRRRQL